MGTLTMADIEGPTLPRSLRDELPVNITMGPQRQPGAVTCRFKVNNPGLSMNIVGDRLAQYRAWWWTHRGNFLTPKPIFDVNEPDEWLYIKMHYEIYTEEVDMKFNFHRVNEPVYDELVDIEMRFSFAEYQTYDDEPLTEFNATRVDILNRLQLQCNTSAISNWKIEYPCELQFTQSEEGCWVGSFQGASTTHGNLENVSIELRKTDSDLSLFFDELEESTLKEMFLKNDDIDKMTITPYNRECVDNYRDAI